MLEHVVEMPEVPDVPEASPLSLRVRIPIQDSADVAVAGEHGRRLASQLEFSSADVTVITTAILEVARNVLAYAGRGDLLLHLIQQGGRSGLSVVAHDDGPGIRDVENALRDGCGEGRSGGLGLATARRLMDEFQIQSEPGRGTTVRMRKWTHRRRVERAGARQGDGE
ncbi:MAG TPA: anti-sigma regulatory factor [Gemmatimonadales bacterium]|jgi:serine/threonine-protein kinase RsbT|nr:anti-sigma regulatory factor [Gemmatimonadales bacterium]